jgi:hypothetical protein
MPLSLFSSETQGILDQAVKMADRFHLQLIGEIKQSISL